MELARVLATTVAALAVLVQSAAAQEWPQRRQWPQNQQPQWRPVPQTGAGGVCVPSGFARLSRNCSVNTGGCQRLPENCNRGWCCP